jgi:hypothetical protein
VPEEDLNRTEVRCRSMHGLNMSVRTEREHVEVGGGRRQSGGQMGVSQVLSCLFDVGRRARRRMYAL